MPIQPGLSGTCPHCTVAVRFEPCTASAGHASFQTYQFNCQTPGGFHLMLSVAACPNCGKPIVRALHLTCPGDNKPRPLDMTLWPDTADRPVPMDVEAEAPGLAADFREGVAVLPKSKKASAALSRRCLQYVLTHKGGAKKRDLADQIDEVLPHLPTRLAENVDAIRNVGNFAAHPLKSTSSGQIVEVEDGEAEWLLDVLEDIFDHYYVSPARHATKRNALNQKLSGLGKPPLKTSPP